jgi:hypothetical protein
VEHECLLRTWQRIRPPHSGSSGEAPSLSNFSASFGMAGHFSYASYTGDCVVQFKASSMDNQLLGMLISAVVLSIHNAISHIEDERL